jgi:hypothetical protein
MSAFSSALAGHPLHTPSNPQIQPGKFGSESAQKLDNAAESMPRMQEALTALKTGLFGVEDGKSIEPQVKQMVGLVRAVSTGLDNAEKALVKYMAAGGVPSAEDLHENTGRHTTDLATHMQNLVQRVQALSQIGAAVGQSLGLTGPAARALSSVAGCVGKAIAEADSTFNSILKGARQTRAELDAGVMLNPLPGTMPVGINYHAIDAVGHLANQAATGQAGVVQIPANLNLKINQHQLSLSFGVDEQGRAYLDLANGKAADAHKMRILLDQESLAVSAVGVDPAQEVDRVERLSRRLEQRIHDTLKTFAELETYKTDQAVADLVKGGHWELVNSKLFKDLVLAGDAKIVSLENGEFVNRNLAGLDLSEVHFHNFSLLRNNAPGLKASGSIFSGEYRIEKNKLNGAQWDNVEFRDGQTGKFWDNDFHGPGASLNGTKFGSLRVLDNNLAGVDLRGIEADSITALRTAQLTNRGEFMAKLEVSGQFGGTIFSKHLLSGDGAATLGSPGVFKASPGTYLSGKTLDISSADLVRTLKDSPFIGTPTPERTENRHGKNVQVLDLHAANGQKLTEVITQSGPFGSSVLPDDETYKTNLYTLSRVLAMYAKKPQEVSAPDYGSLGGC